jgi:hypothetical protein
MLNEKTQSLDMKSYSLLRRLSIVCYLFIFIQGMMIALPFIFFLTFGIVYADPRERIFIILANLGLILLAILSFYKKTKVRIALECLVYLVLLSPLIRLAVIFPVQTLEFPLFFIPFGGFVLLYPLSVLSSYLEYRQK